MNVSLYFSPNKTKKYRVIFENGDKIDFGAKGYSDYTIHKDTKRKERYIARHSKNENWTKSGIKTAGFWSRWLLWNKKTLKSSANYIKDKFGICFT